jgi:tetratricopeptide (TPR) repeat protein
MKSRDPAFCGIRFFRTFVTFMEESFDSYFDGETLSLVGRFESMIREEQHFFFDVDEFEEIIEYYFYKSEQRKAFLTINQALEQHPGCPSILLKLAQLKVNIHKDHEALRILRELDHMETSDSDLHMAKGNLYSQLEKPEKAIEEYRKAAKGADYVDEIHASIAFEYETMGKYDKAIDHLLEALEINPGNDPALYEFAFCCEVSQQTERCISYLLSFIDRQPYSVAAWFNLGIAYSNLDLHEKAIEAYDYVLAIDDTFSSAHFNKANCYANVGNYDKAIETYQETFYFEDAEPVTYYYIAECHEKLRKFDIAIDYYNKAAGLDPGFADAWLGLGV